MDTSGTAAQLHAIAETPMTVLRVIEYEPGMTTTTDPFKD